MRCDGGNRRRSIRREPFVKHNAKPLCGRSSPIGTLLGFNTGYAVCVLYFTEVQEASRSWF